MSRFGNEPFPIDLLDIDERLRGEKPRASAVELDRIKLRAMAGASRREARPAARRAPKLGFRAPRRLVAVALAVGLMGGGTAVLAKSGDPAPGSSGASSANSQYCPATSQQPGTPKDPRPSKCGNPKTK
jgi:hypothetical protein